MMQMRVLDEQCLWDQEESIIAVGEMLVVNDIRTPIHTFPRRLAARRGLGPLQGGGRGGAN